MCESTFAFGLQTIWNMVPDQTKDQLLNAVKTTVIDATDKIATGKRTVEEWAEIIIKVVDRIKDQKTEEENLKYVGGRLAFQISKKNTDSVCVSFQLYFLDENKEWKTANNDCDLSTSYFTPDALNELKNQGKIEFDVEE